jgi:5-methylcytosine-specific restriction endonuclease McrA
MGRPRLYTTEERLARRKASTARWRKANPEWLKASRKTTSARHRQKHRARLLEESRERGRKQRAAMTPEERTAASVQHGMWNKAHPESGRAANQKWRQRHPEKLRAINKAASERKAAWSKAHPDVIIAAVQRRRARKASAPRNDLTRTQWLLIQETQDHRCAYCDKRCKGRMTQDHITPLSQGGAHTLHNVVGVCRSCNSTKGVKAPLKAVQPLLL